MPRRFQFSMRTLLVATLIAAISLAWLAQRRNKKAEESAITKVLMRGGMIGGDRNQTVTEVVFAGQRGDVELAANITDDDLEALRALPNLQKLDLTDRAITDAAVPALSRLRRLRVLKVCGTKITENGISRLRAALPECTIEW